jgi:hypothetical protein
VKTGDAGELKTAPRTHPWSDSVANPAWRYRDLRAEPGLIRTALEDFLPYGELPAIDAFYTLLEWLNGPHCDLETSDCAFTGPSGGECEGRVIVLFRDHAANTRQRIVALVHQLHASLAAMDPAWQGGMIGTTLVPVHYVSTGQDGFQLLISFWAWGQSDVEVMTNLRRAIANLAKALRSRAVK